MWACMDGDPAFGPFDGRAWLDTAHQGPLPDEAVAVSHEWVSRKASPHELSDESFTEIPRRLRASIARLVGGKPEDIVLGNSTTYGLNLLAQGLPLREGDEILLVEGDFPATVYPWMPLTGRGVRIRFLPAPGGAPDPDELREAIGERTRVFCSSWVFSFTGHAADTDGLARVCRERGVTFVLNGSQAVGARPADVGRMGVDALVSCGFKWLCGPYATGFCWLRPEVRRSLEYRQGYWLAQLPGDDFTRPPASYELRDDLGAAAYDVFCTANVSTFPAWTSAIDLLLDRGIETIAAHDQELVGRLIDGLPPGWRLRSPRSGPERSTLVFAGPVGERSIEDAHRRLSEAGIDVARRAGALRISPHLHNGADDIDRLLGALERMAETRAAVRT
jgi:cysteine desulfurase/selenocysteine lyase